MPRTPLAVPILSSEQRAKIAGFKSYFSLACSFWEVLEIKTQMINLKVVIASLLLVTYVVSQYDIIIVGAGTASSIVASKLVQEHEDKSFLILEAGVPVSQKLGSQDYPPYAQQQVALTDVPGEYAAIAFAPNGDQYKLKEAPFTWQGMGYGGNSQFNGMLFQSVPVSNMDNWPAGWKSEDMLPFYQRVISKVHVTPTPSKDGVDYLTDIADVFRGAFTASGLTEEDTTIITSELESVPKGYFSRPYVVTDGNGQRGGIVDGYLTQIIDASGASSKSNLDIVPRAKVSKILFDAEGTATGVEYYVRESKDDQGSNAQQGEKRTATLNAGGRVILGAGALITPRLLYLSGVGPAGQENDLGTGLNFAINNPAVGTVFTDHVGAQISVGYSKAKNYNYRNYTATADDIAKYINDRSGPYAQYGPVLFAHVKSSSTEARPNIEILINPTSAGGSAQVSGDDVFQVMLFTLDQKARGKLRLDGNNFVQSPGVYLTNNDDIEQMVDALYTLLNDIIPRNSDLRVVLGPGGVSHPTLNPGSRDDLRTFLTGATPNNGVYYTRMTLNHFTGTVPLVEGDESAGGVDPATLRVRGTKNVHVVDASLYPTPMNAHPVATVMAGAELAAERLTALIGVPVETTQAPSSAAPETTEGPATSQAPETTEAPATSGAPSSSSPSSSATPSSASPSSVSPSASGLTTVKPTKTPSGTTKKPSTTKKPATTKPSSSTTKEPVNISGNNNARTSGAAAVQITAFAVLVVVAMWAALFNL
jgi:cellobiose dehydrogenase (acceptor)